MRWMWVALAVLCSGCAQNLPPHVYLPIHRVEGVDLFWWTDQQQCALRVIFWRSDGFPAGFTLQQIDKHICYEWLKAEGYKVPK